MTHDDFQVVKDLRKEVKWLQEAFADQKENAERYRLASLKGDADNAALRAELLKATGSLGLMIAGANPKAEGHKANLESARKILCETATPDELVCPTCKSAQWAEIYPSKTDPTGCTLYCRRCEEGCVTPARAALAQGGAK